MAVLSLFQERPLGSTVRAACVHSHTKLSQDCFEMGLEVLLQMLMIQQGFGSHLLQVCSMAQGVQCVSHAGYALC